MITKLGDLPIEIVNEITLYMSIEEIVRVFTHINKRWTKIFRHMVKYYIVKQRTIEVRKLLDTKFVINQDFLRATDDGNCPFIIRTEIGLYLHKDNGYMYFQNRLIYKYCIAESISRCKRGVVIKGTSLPHGHTCYIEIIKRLLSKEYFFSRERRFDKRQTGYSFFGTRKTKKDCVKMVGLLNCYINKKGNIILGSSPLIKDVTMENIL